MTRTISLTKSVRIAQESEARRSQAVQRGLPRPTAVPSNVRSDTDSEAAALIQEEFLKLLKHDAIRYPVAGGKVAPGAISLGDLAGLEDEFDSEELANARRAMDEELALVLGVEDDADIKEAVWKHVKEQDDFEDLWNKEHLDVMFSEHFNRFMTLDEMTDDKDKVQGLGKLLEVSLRYLKSCWFSHVIYLSRPIAA